MHKILACYKFVSLAEERVDEIQSEYELIAEKHHVMGLVVLGVEGVNFTVAVPAENLEAFWAESLLIPEFSDLEYKLSESDTAPFKRFKVKTREEIVTLNREDYFPGNKNNHISPAEWNRIMKEDGDHVIIDTRNDYEVEVGKFKGALDPQLKMFTEFPEFVRKSGIPKDKKVLMYCTGGIRCEKAIYEMQSQGYTDVSQLDGGILKYLEEFPEDQFQGECFVFDHRVAVNQELQPSTHFHLCPHCGNPGDVITNCLQCGEVAKICNKCQPQQSLNTCSKNCEHHFGRKNSVL